MKWKKLIAVVVMQAVLWSGSGAVVMDREMHLRKKQFANAASVEAAVKESMQNIAEHAEYSKKIAAIPSYELNERFQSWIEQELTSIDNNSHYFKLVYKPEVGSEDGFSYEDHSYETGSYELVDPQTFTITRLGVDYDPVTTTRYYNYAYTHTLTIGHILDIDFDRLISLLKGGAWRIDDKKNGKEVLIQLKLYQIKAQVYRQQYKSIPAGIVEYLKGFSFSKEQEILLGGLLREYWGQSDSFLSKQGTDRILYLLSQDISAPELHHYLKDRLLVNFRKAIQMLEQSI